MSWRNHAEIRSRTRGSRWAAPILAAAAFLVAVQGPAQRALGETAGDPLLPADTSSPRATLRTFLENMDAASKAWLRNERAQERFWARQRAVETLDLSTTPDGASASVQRARALLLQEILARIELPPFEEIPGAREVEESFVTEWTLPGTPIKIEQIRGGPRAGQFLFSAGSVDRLGRYYRRIKHLPYQPGASGIYEAYLTSDRSEFAFSSGVRNRLKPIDASSPRSTLEGFLYSMNRAYVIARDTNAALRADPTSMSRQEALEEERKADNYLRRARGALDLSQVGGALREQVGIEAAFQLKEILDRIPLPPLDSVPGQRRVVARRQARAGPLTWRIPDTALEITEIAEGERAGQFLFSAATVERIPEVYEELEDLPYRAGGLTRFNIDYLSPETSEGFYERYISSPGHLIPNASFAGRLILGLPDGFRKLYGGLTIWQWAGLVLLCGLLLPIAALVVFRSVRRLAGALAAPWDDWLTIASPLLIAVLVDGTVRFVDDDLNVSGGVLSAVTAGGRLIVLVMAAWAAFVVCRAVAETLILSPKVVRVADQSLDASLLRIASRVVAFLIAAWIVVAGIRSLGIDVVPLVAGLGVGGLAVALAAQTTFANFIGSLILYANKPIRRGDFCAYGDKIGTVEHIGLHSTRIRSLERTVVTVPNADFAQLQLENISVRDRRLFRPTLHLRYETTPEQLRYVLAKVREMLMGHPKVLPEPGRVRFEGYGPGSKDVGIFAYLDCQSQDDYLAIAEDLLLRIEDIVSEAGTAFAIPAQTSYLAQAAVLDAARREEAEARVGQWRSEDRLPFPEFADEERRRLTDVLDYPPEGSPDHRPRKEPSEAAPEVRPVRRTGSPWSGSSG